MMKPLNIKNKVVKHDRERIGGVDVSAETIVPIDQHDKPVYVLKFGSSYTIEFSSTSMSILRMLLDEMVEASTKY